MPHITPSAGLRVPSQIKFLPTANVLDYGEDLALHLTTVGMTEQAVTFSSSAITRSLDEGGQPLDAFPHVYADTDDGLLLHEGNDTAFNVDYVFNSDMVASVLKFSVNVCMGLNVSAHTSGNFNIGIRQIQLVQAEQQLIQERLSKLLQLQTVEKLQV